MRVLPVSFNWQNIQIIVPRSTSLIRLIRRNAHIVRSKFDCSFSSIAFFIFVRVFSLSSAAASAASGIDPNEREITLMSTKIVSNVSNNSTRARACTRTRYTFFRRAPWLYRSSIFSLVFFFFFLFNSYSHSGCWLFGKNLCRLHNFLSFHCVDVRCAM